MDHYLENFYFQLKIRARTRPTYASWLSACGAIIFHLSSLKITLRDKISLVVDKINRNKLRNEFVSPNIFLIKHRYRLICSDANGLVVRFFVCVFLPFLPRPRPIVLEYPIQPTTFSCR